MTKNLVRVHYCAVMVTDIQFLIFFLWILSRISKKSLYKRKKWIKSVNDFFIAVLLHFYDLNHLNLTKSRLSNQKSDMVPEVTLIPNVSMNIVTKFQVSIFKNDKVRGGGSFNPPLRRISWLWGLHGIGLSTILYLIIDGK